jgi:uncharacterized membrane protein YkvA (DUF1232 family)
VRVFLIALAAVVGLWLTLVVILAVAGRSVAARELALLLPHLIFLFRGILRDPRVPRGPKVVLALAGLWLASPIDLIPEFIPVLGPVDDAVVAALALRYVVKRAGPEVVTEHWRGDPATLARILRLSRAAP